MDPATMALLAKYGVPAVSKFLGSFFGTRHDDKQKEKDRQLTRDLQTQRLGYDESTLDPWRNLSSQMNHAGALDRTANATYTPVKLSAGPGGAVQRTGGTDYQKSPDLVNAARQAAKLVLSGFGQTPSAVGRALPQQENLLPTEMPASPLGQRRSSRSPYGETLGMPDPWSTT